MSSSADIDHIVCGAADLGQGSAFIRRLTGVSPLPGGQHPRWGTHNALISLGPHRYLEILAPDPRRVELSPELAFLLELEEPRLVGWAAHANIDAVARWLGQSGRPPLEPQSGMRRRPDGAVLEWRLLGFLTGGIDPFPFFIQWSEGSTHPSEGAPAGCSLLTLELEHRQTELLQSVLNFLDLDVLANRGPELRIRARLETPAGVVELH